MSSLENKVENKAIVRHFVELAQSQGQLSAIDEYLSSHFIDHSAPAGLPNDREGVKLQFAMLRSAFPDMQAVIHDQVAGDDKVVTRKSLRGTHLGDFLGIAPTGKAISLEVIDILRLVDGKIVEHWNVVDLMGLMMQMGVMPAAATA
jgi:predicted ester cyclase